MSGKQDDGRGIWYEAEKDIDGAIADGGPAVRVQKGAKLRSGYFDEHSVEFDWPEWDVTVCLDRKTVCDDVSSLGYYANYFALVDGLRRLPPEEASQMDEAFGFGKDPGNQKLRYDAILRLLMDAELAARNGQWPTCGTACRNAMGAAFAFASADPVGHGEVK